VKITLANVDQFSKFSQQLITKKIPAILPVRWKSLWCIHREFLYESIGENRSIFAKVIIKHQGHTFLRHSVLCLQ